MGKFVLVAVATVAVSTICAGAPCTTGTLSSYIALGSTGCTIGTNNLFDFQAQSGVTGATAIATSTVSLTPLGGALDPGLISSVGVSASSGSLLETIFTYKISGNSYISSSLTLTGSSETGSGAVTGLENFCAGGIFGPGGTTGCTGVAGSLVTLDGIQGQDSRSFSSVTLLSVTNDLTFDAGRSGSASGGTLTDRFTAIAAIPEPVTTLLTAVGLMLVVAGRKKFIRSGL